MLRVNGNAALGAPAQGQRCRQGTASTATSPPFCAWPALATSTSGRQPSFCLKDYAHVRRVQHARVRPSATMIGEAFVLFGERLARPLFSLASWRVALPPGTPFFHLLIYAPALPLRLAEWPVTAAVSGPGGASPPTPPQVRGAAHASQESGPLQLRVARNMLALYFAWRGTHCAAS